MAFFRVLCLPLIFFFFGLILNIFRFATNYIFFMAEPAWLEIDGSWLPGASTTQPHLDCPWLLQLSSCSWESDFQLAGEKVCMSWPRHGQMLSFRPRNVMLVGNPVMLLTHLPPVWWAQQDHPRSSTSKTLLWMGNGCCHELRFDWKGRTWYLGTWSSWWHWW